MDVNDFSVADKWNDFKIIPASAYDVFILKHYNESEEWEAHFPGAYDRTIPFRSFRKAEEHIAHLLGTENFKGLSVVGVEYEDGKFVYRAFDKDLFNSTVFEIIPEKFCD